MPNPPRSPRSESLVRQTAGPPHRGGVPRALGTARPTNSRARATQPGGRGEARAPEAALAHGPQLPNGNAHVERQRATGGPHSARVTARKKQARARARPAARPCAAPTRSPGPPLPHRRGGGARAEGRSPFPSRPEVAGAQRRRPARPRPPLCGVGLLPQCHSLAAFPPLPEPSPGDATAAAASALPAGPASPPGASVLPSLLQDRQDFLLTAPWAPSYIQPSQPMGAEYTSRENGSSGSRESCRSDLKGTLLSEREVGRTESGSLVVERSATPMDAPP